MGLDEVLGTAGKTLADMQARLEKLEAWRAAVEAHPELPPVLTAEYISGYLDISLSQAYATLKSKKLVTFRAGRSVRCTKEAFLDFIANGGDEDAIQQGGKAV